MVGPLVLAWREGQLSLTFVAVAAALGTGLRW